MTTQFSHGMTRSLSEKVMRHYVHAQVRVLAGTSKAGPLGRARIARLFDAIPAEKRTELLATLANELEPAAAAASLGAPK